MKKVNPRRLLKSAIKTIPAFTLAEVLITIMVIGIIATMTIPTLVSNTRKKELRTAFFKTFSELNQLSMKFKVENGMSVPEYFGTEQLSSTINGEKLQKLMSYYKDVVSLTSTGMGTNDGTGNFVPYYVLRHTGGKIVDSGKNTQGSNSSFICDNSGFKLDASGKVMIFNDDNIIGQNGPVVCVDVNGKKKPNMYGVDYFIFLFTMDGAVIPMGQPHINNPVACTSTSGSCDNFSNTVIASGENRYCKKKASNIIENSSCAYYALNDTHPDNPTKNYWTDFINEVYDR